MTTYLLLRTNLNGGNPMIITTTIVQAGCVPALSNYCSANNMGLVDWSWRGVKDTNGTYVSSPLGDEVTYNIFQVFSLDDWGGDPAQNHWVNDIGMLRWVVLGGLLTNAGTEEVKSSEWDEI